MTPRFLVFFLLVLAGLIPHDIRAAVGGGSDHTAGPTARAPFWVKLERRGSAFSGSVSTDGASWTKVGEATIEMGADVFAGFAVTAHNNGAACTATFDHTAVSK